MKSKLTKLALMCLSATYIQAAQPAGHLVFEGGDGPGKGKHLVLISGDEEYRSEESMPMLGQNKLSQTICIKTFFMICKSVVFWSINK